MDYWQERRGHCKIKIIDWFGFNHNSQRRHSRLAVRCTAVVISITKCTSIPKAGFHIVCLPLRNNNLKRIFGLKAHLYGTVKSHVWKKAWNRDEVAQGEHGSLLVAHACRKGIAWGVRYKTRSILLRFCNLGFTVFLVRVPGRSMKQVCPGPLRVYNLWFLTRMRLLVLFHPQHTSPLLFQVRDRGQNNP